MKDFTAKISEDSERAKTWQEVMGTDKVYLKSPLPALASLPGTSKRLIYELDLIMLNDTQRKNLIRYISKKFNIPTADVARDLDILGCPVLVEDVTVSVQNPQKQQSGGEIEHLR